MIGPLFAIAAVALQSAGKVLYGDHLDGVSTALFVLVVAVAATLLFMPATRFRLPGNGLRAAVANNVWTAIGFIAFFFALKHLPPATVAATEIGVSLVTGIAAASWAGRAWPHWKRLAACAGILVGCTLLAGLALTDTGPVTAMVWVALAASVVAGVAVAFTVTCSRGLMGEGWSMAAVLAHRFYLTMAAALAWVVLDGGALPTVGTTGAILAVGAISLLVPMVLMLFALRRIDSLTALVCSASQPLLSFAFSLASPEYSWDPLSMLGVAIVTAFVGFDIAVNSRKPAGGAA
jgi:drug/metabolite transporter (DMT)-like permease